MSDLWIRRGVAVLVLVPVLLAIVLGCAARLILESFRVGWRVGKP